MKSIKLLHRKEVDTEKWDKVVRLCEGANVYGMSWYLDAVTDANWHGVVINDYEYIMPVYIKKKFFLPYITQPFLCQRCGPYIHPDSKKYAIEELLEAMPGFVLKAAFNLYYPGELNLLNYTIIPKTNQYLSLDKDFAEILSGYNRSTRRNLAKSEEYPIEISESEDHQTVFEFLTENDDTGILKRHQISVKKLIEKASGNTDIICQSARMEGKLIGAGFYVLFEGRIYWLMSAVNGQGRASRVMFSMVNRIIEKYSGQDWVFDFCGSSIPNVAQRNSGFGASEEKYYHLVRKGRLL